MFPMQGNQSDEKLYVDDVFSTYLYTGNGSTQTITNGIDLAGKGGLVWFKARTSAYDPVWLDTERGTTQQLYSSLTNAQSANPSAITSVSSSGYSMGAATIINGNGTNFVSWAFRKAPKFFDVVTYTGNGVAGRTIAHSLGQAPGMIIVKCASSGSQWAVYHRSLGGTKYMWMDTSAAISSTAYWNDTDATSTVFTLGNTGAANGNGDTYVAYLFAHDTSADGIIQCGSFTTDGSGNATVNLGWEPQYVLHRPSASSSDWFVNDSLRGMSVTGGARLSPNLSSTEIVTSAPPYYYTAVPNATGFSVNDGVTSQSHIYLAIRRPNKPPTTGTQVYNAIARTGTGAAATVTGVGFAPDLVMVKGRATGGSDAWWLHDRLRGMSSTSAAILQSSNTGAEFSVAPASSGVLLDGATAGTVQMTSGTNINTSAVQYINHFFRRAVGCFDQVCWIANSSGARDIQHNLGVAPELCIIKNRSVSENWLVASDLVRRPGYPTQPAVISLSLSNAAEQVTGLFQSNGASADFTPTVIKITGSTYSYFSGGQITTNVSGNMTAYLFATKAGISKVGSYTGNGSSQTINCGFAAGARFFLVKATSTTGSWWVFDSARGIVSATDFGLQLNSTAAETTSADAVDPDASGIIVNQEATCSINANGVSYVFLAIS